MTGKTFLKRAAVAGAAMVAGFAIAGDSATSAPGMIDSRRSASSGASATFVEARSGHSAAFASDITSNIDTATSIGTLIFFR